MKNKQLESENAYFNKAHEAMNNNNIELSQQINKAKMETAKQEDTVAHMFTRTKTLSALINGFYSHCYGEKESEQNKGPYVISYENLHKKIERLFKDYETLAKKTRRFDFSAIPIEPDALRHSGNLTDTAKDKRSVSNNIAPKNDVLFRNKSPAPGYGGSNPYPDKQNGTQSNRGWNFQ